MGLIPHADPSLTSLGRCHLDAEATNLRHEQFGIIMQTVPCITYLYDLLSFLQEFNKKILGQLIEHTYIYVNYKINFM